MALKASKEIKKYIKGAKTKYEKHLLKATYPFDVSAPKEKYIQNILSSLKGQDNETTFDKANQLLG